jgi:hypothetical protein
LRRPDLVSENPESEECKVVLSIKFCVRNTPFPVITFAAIDLIGIEPLNKHSKHLGAVLRKLKLLFLALLESALESCLEVFDFVTQKLFI